MSDAGRHSFLVHLNLNVCQGKPVTADRAIPRAKGEELFKTYQIIRLSENLNAH